MIDFRYFVILVFRKAQTLLTKFLIEDSTKISPQLLPPRLFYFPTSINFPRLVHFLFTLNIKLKTHLRSLVEVDMRWQKETTINTHNRCGNLHTRNRVDFRVVFLLWWCRWYPEEIDVRRNVDGEKAKCKQEISSSSYELFMSFL